MRNVFRINASIKEQEFSDEIFKHMPIHGNEEVSLLKGYDLQDFIVLTDDFSFPLRHNIGASSKNTIGLELECEYADYFSIDKEMIKGWSIVGDASLTEGIEINSPILRDTKKNWEELRCVCDTLSKYAKEGKHAAGHIHIGKQAYSDNKSALVRFMYFWIRYEHIILRFTNGEFLCDRPEMSYYAKPITDLLIDILNRHSKFEYRYSDLIHDLSYERYQAVNFQNYNSLKTIEFRCPNISFNPVIWQNNVNLFLKILKYVSSDEFDIDSAKKIIEERKKGVVINYNKVYIEDALNFADIVFDNNLDKVYFFKQYLKSFEESRRYVKAKTFSKS